MYPERGARGGAEEVERKVLAENYTHTVRVSASDEDNFSPYEGERKETRRGRRGRSFGGRWPAREGGRAKGQRESEDGGRGRARRTVRVETQERVMGRGPLQLIETGSRPAAGRPPRGASPGPGTPADPPGPATRGRGGARRRVDHQPQNSTPFGGNPPPISLFSAARREIRQGG